MDREARERIDEIASLVNDSEVFDYSSPNVVWDDEVGYSIEDEGVILEDMVWGGLTESEAKTLLKEYKERLKKATMIVKDLVDKNVIISEDEIWDYIDDDDDDYYDDDDDYEVEDDEEED